MKKKFKKVNFKAKQQRKQEVELRKLDKQIKEANARLASLEKHYKRGSWASKQLYEKLTATTIKAINTKGRIRIPKSSTKTQITAISKAVAQFMNAKTSTNKGIKAVKRKTLKSIKKTLEVDEEISDEDIEDMYDLLGTDDFDYFADKTEASTVWALGIDAKEENQDVETFTDLLASYSQLENDSDVRERAKRLYKKFVK